MTDYKGQSHDMLIEKSQQNADCKSLQHIIETLQKQMKVKDDKIKHTEEKLLAMQTEIECLKEANKKLNEIISAAPNFVPQSPSSHREGISAEPMSSLSVSQPKLTKYPKDLSCRNFISDALNNNSFMRNLGKPQLNEMVDCMYIRQFDKGQLICKEGQVGIEFYVLSEGEVRVTKDGKFLQDMKPGVAFGELAILYNCNRTATVEAITHTKVWAIDRNAFHVIMMKTGVVRQKEQLSFLRRIPLFRNFSDGDILKIADVLQEECYFSGEYIVRQGCKGDTFFIISEGTVKVTHKQTPAGAEVTITELSKGEFFGEKALQGAYIRTASVIATSDVSCFTLDKDHFHQLINPNAHWPQTDKEMEELAKDEQPVTESEVVPSTNKCNDLDSVQLCNLEHIQLLGSGGFGKVYLVQLRNDDTKTFALKCMAKSHIVSTHQQDHIFSEKDILSKVHCPFIAKLYTTFRCSKYLYILTEVCLGGEVWTLLRDLGCFDEKTTRFCTGCVVEAFDYLHCKGIVYRDLKPENLLLDAHGYVKLVDFGFAKKLVPNHKTWTFCGTPEYVSPEIILNKGHDFASDYWSLGILIFELLTGNPPFNGGDSMKTYNSILRGIDAVDFPRKVQKNAQHLIKRLCKVNPSERLGNLHGGIKDIKTHRWFEGFDWESLKNQTMRAALIPNVRGSKDTANFDLSVSGESFQNAAEDFSGWDEKFGPLEKTPGWLL